MRITACLSSNIEDPRHSPSHWGERRFVSSKDRSNLLVMCFKSLLRVGILVLLPTAPTFFRLTVAMSTTAKRLSKIPKLAASVTLASTVLVQVADPTAAYAGDIRKGEVLFQNACASCHIDGSNLVDEQRTLKKEALEKFGIGLDQPSIEKFVTNSLRHKNLVFFRVEGGKLNPEQWEDVTTYISDQASGDKW